MPNNFEINIINESGNSQSYLLFCALPQISSGPQSYQNIWMAAPTIVSNPQGKSSTKFIINRQFYGICGTSVNNLNTGVLVSTSDYEEVNLGDGHTPGTLLNFSTTGGAHLTPVGNNGPLNAGFTIKGDSSWRIPDPNNTFVGLGGVDMKGNVVPVATWLAAPSTTYNIFPQIEYYISTGTYVEGQIVDVQSLGVYQIVDFSNSTYNTQTFVHNNDGTYSRQSPAATKAHRLKTLALEKAIKLGEIEQHGTGSSTAGLVDEDLLAKKLQQTFLKWIQSSDLSA